MLIISLFALYPICFFLSFLLSYFAYFTHTPISLFFFIFLYCYIFSILLLFKILYSCFSLFGINSESNRLNIHRAKVNLFITILRSINILNPLLTSGSLQIKQNNFWKLKLLFWIYIRYFHIEVSKIILKVLL